MSLPAGLALREATTDDLPRIVALRESVEWTPHAWAMRAVIDEPDSAFVVATDETGEVAAMGSGIAYPPRLGFVGNMVVAERHRRRGVGSAILDAVVDRLTALGCDRLELNATEEGRPLYERHGFASRGVSVAAAMSRRALRRLGPVHPVREAGPDEIERIVAYDAPRFGGDRGRLLRRLTEEGSGQALISEGGDGIDGYAIVVAEDRRFGPMVADAPETAASLVAGAFERDPELADVRFNLPPANVDGAAWLERVRVASRPWEGRMARGPEVERRDETIYQMAAGPLG